MVEYHPISAKDLRDFTSSVQKSYQEYSSVVLYAEAI